MTSKNKGNPVSNRSKIWIQNALLKLMEKENYQEITIQEITDHAGLSRRTFYRNFSSKDEIINTCFLNIWYEYESLINMQSDLCMANVGRIFFTVMEKHMDFLLLINRHHLIPILIDEIDELLPPLFQKVKGKALPFSEERIAYALTFSIGGFMRILVKWLNEDIRKSPKEMADIVKDIFLILNTKILT